MWLRCCPFCGLSGTIGRVDKYTFFCSNCFLELFVRKRKQGREIHAFRLTEEGERVSMAVVSLEQKGTGRRVFFEHNS